MILRKWFKLPSPVDLGWSEVNALGSREFGAHEGQKTWEDWGETVKGMYPVRYFLAETLPDLWAVKIWWPIKRPISDAHYWLVSHLIPSRRYHMLDLRQPGGYRHGWLDVDSKMLYAWFNLLREYLEKENPYDLRTDHTDEEIEADEGLKTQQFNLDEARAIHRWWTVERVDAEKLRDHTLSQWCELRKTEDPEKERLWDAMRAMEEASEEKTDEMLGRLIKIRRSLWT